MTHNAFNASMLHKTLIQPVMRPEPFPALSKPVCGEIQISLREFVVNKQDARKSLPCHLHQLQGFPERHLVQKADENSVLPCPRVGPKGLWAIIDTGYVQTVP